MKGFPDLPPLWLLGFCLAAWFMARWVPLFDLSGPVLRWAGAVLALAGIGVIFWSGLWFLRKKTTIEPHEEPTTLITQGPFRLSRNPIYLAMVVILLGVVLWQGGLSGLVLPPIFMVLLSRRFILPEEQGLRDHFGAAAQDYMQATKRWL